MSHTITSVAVAALLALGGCGNKTEKPSPTASTGAGSATATASDSIAAGSAAPGSAQTGSVATGSGDNAATAVDVPTKVDFEDEASAKITDKNVEAQVQAMEKQLEQK
jgi:hypothetical protein